VTGEAGRLSRSLRIKLLRTAFGSLYGPLARFYDLITVIFFAGEWARWQDAAAARLTGSRILELGPGTGALAVRLIGAGYDYTGLEPSPAMLAVARRRLRAFRGPAGLVRGRAQQLPFKDCSFDSVLATFPTEYALEPATWSEVLRVLRPGGRWVVVYAGALKPVGLRRRLAGLAQRLVLGPPDDAAEPALPEVPGFQVRFWEGPTPGGTAFGWEAVRTLPAEVPVELPAADAEQNRVPVGTEEADAGPGRGPE